MVCFDLSPCQVASNIFFSVGKVKRHCFVWLSTLNIKEIPWFLQKFLSVVFICSYDYIYTTQCYIALHWYKVGKQIHGHLFAEPVFDLKRNKEKKTSTLTAYKSSLKTCHEMLMFHALRCVFLPTACVHTLRWIKKTPSLRLDGQKNK